MFITAVLCADAEGFATWCRSQGFTGVSDGAESHSGKWLAVRILQPSDLAGLVVHRVDYAPGFWRGERTSTEALDTLAQAVVHRPQPAPGDNSPAQRHARG
ncbi:MAG: hypothetical protein ACKV2O_22885 [Acidimicrobiales bacterium]